MRSGRIGLSIRASTVRKASHQRGRDGPEAEYRARAPAVRARLHDGVDGAHQRGRDQERSEPVDAGSRALACIVGDQSATEGDGHHADGQVDEEDPVPAERLSEHSPGEQAERSAGDGDEHVCAHRSGALARLRELGGDDREDHRRLHRGADALDEAGADQFSLTGRKPAERRGGREHDHAGEEHTLAAEQIAESTGEEQEAGEGDEEGVDDPGEVSLAEVQVALDGGEGHVHDRRVEHDHQLGEANDRERQPAAPVAAGDGRGRDALHAESWVGGNRW